MEINASLTSHLLLESKNGMHSDPQNSYLEAQVLTATPQKQRLMLIDGAMRFIRQATQLWEENQDERALDALTSSREIVSELLASIKVQQGDLPRQVAAIYVFVFQAVTEAQLRRSAEKLEEVLDVLAIERETWHLVCEQMPEAPTPSAEERAAGPQEILAPTSTSFSDANLSGGSFSLEA